MILTELLYPCDEVIMSLIQSLLKKDIVESLYWVWELMYSGKDILYIIHSIFLDFYAIHTPSMEGVINKNFKKYLSNKNKIHIADIISNLMNATPCIHIYKIRNNMNYRPTYIYKKKKWIYNFPDIYHPLILSIKNNNYNNISYYLNLCCNEYGSDNTHLNIIKYFKYLNDDCNIEDIISYWNNRYKSNDYHTLLSLIISFINNDYPDFKYNEFTNKELIDELDDNYIFIINNNNYNKLKYRLFSTHITLGPYKYDRIHYDLNYVYENWFYFIKDTPSWRERLNKYNIIYDNTISIDDNIILNENKIELFLEDLDCEFDEQSLDIKNKSNHDINIIQDYDKWFNDTYNPIHISYIISNI
jgi:hypothetical protein